ncbi:MAG: hypothetical protein ACE5EV_03975 [Gaiellales bacterium]
MIRGIGLGLSLTLVAAGAVLAWAVTADPDEIDLVITGYVIFGIGLFGLGIWLVNSLVTRWAIRTGRFAVGPGGTTYLQSR